MKYINLQSEGRKVGYGVFKRWAGCALGLVLFLSAAGSQALADAAMTQGQYLQWMAGICGDRLGNAASSGDYVNWARGKGMNPPDGWQLGAKLTKDVVAHTLVQLLNLAPRKGNFDAVQILQREGIIITTTDGYVTLKNFVRLIDDGLARGRLRNGQNDDDDDGNNGNGNGNNDDDGDRDDDDGPRPTPTKPGHGHGDDNHDHTGPPGQGNPKPGNGGGKGPH